VVAHNSVRAGEGFEKLTHARELPLVFEMSDPAGAEDEQRSLADGGVGDPLAADLAEPDLLLHGPHARWPDRAMSRRWPAAARRRQSRRGHDGSMHSRYVDGITIRPLRNGDTETVSCVFERLGEESRRRRFGGAKPALSESELAQLARVDRN